MGTKRCAVYLCTGLLALLSPLAAQAPEDQVFIADSSGLKVSDINTLAAVQDLPGTLVSCCGGFDDGRHMVIDSRGGRIFVSHHDFDFQVFDFTLAPLSPTWGVSLTEPLGIAPLADGRILITDEEGFAAAAGLFRLNFDLTLDRAASGGGSFLFDGAEGVAYDALHNRIYVADEDDGDIEIFDGTTLAHINSVAVGGSDGPYWLDVDGSSNRLFVLFDFRLGGSWGIKVYTLTSGGDGLSFETTLVAPAGPLVQCFGTLAVSESRKRLFAIDFCSDTVALYDTATLASLGTVPASRAGSAPLMVSVGHLFMVGDGNGDGVLNAADLVALLQEIGDGDAEIPAGFDVNTDSKLDLNDVIALVQRIFGAF